MAKIIRGFFGRTTDGLDPLRQEARVTIEAYADGANFNMTLIRLGGIGKRMNDMGA